ncbi:MAG: signal peptidase II [Chloroflexi bacterium]|nr:signal peptidase II [Chloroflexota bacterium]
MRRTLIPMLAVLLLDVLVKASAQQMLPPGESVPIAADLFRLTLGYNSGVAFGLFAGGGPWPLVMSGIIIVGLGIWVMRALRVGELPPAASWPIGLILGGAIANFGDRLPDGRVTDFLDVGVGATRWPTFNLADSFIVLGVALLVLIVGHNGDQSATGRAA